MNMAIKVPFRFSLPGYSYHFSLFIIDIRLCATRPNHLDINQINHGESLVSFCDDLRNDIAMLIIMMIIPPLRIGREGIPDVDRSIILSSSPLSSHTPRHFGNSQVLYPDVL